jgi:hypothetical protein
MCSRDPERGEDATVTARGEGSAALWEGSSPVEAPLKIPAAYIVSLPTVVAT